jgi:hypothetical protein
VLYKVFTERLSTHIGRQPLNRPRTRALFPPSVTDDARALFEPFAPFALRRAKAIPFTRLKQEPLMKIRLLTAALITAASASAFAQAPAAAPAVPAVPAVPAMPVTAAAPVAAAASGVHKAEHKAGHELRKERRDVREERREKREARKERREHRQAAHAASAASAAK